MKTKKRVTSFILALVVAIALIVTPNYNAQAATYVYSPDNVYQTSAKGKKITVSWSPAKNAVAYNVYVRLGGSTGQIVTAGRVTSAGAALSGVVPGTTYYIQVYSVAADGTVSSYGSSKTLYAAPMKPKNVHLYSWTVDSNKPYVEWAGYNSSQTGYYSPDGYEVKVMTLGGKNVRTYNINSAYLFNKAIPKIKNAGFKVKVRSYTVINSYNGPKFKAYSAWSDVKAFVPQPKMGATYRYRESTATFSWKPIKNASAYTIYKVTKSGNSYKFSKYKTVSGSVTSVSVPKSLGRVTVFPTVKVGGRAYKATYKDRVNFYGVNLN